MQVLRLKIMAFRILLEVKYEDKLPPVIMIYT